jgi:hypothetical protein
VGSKRKSLRAGNIAGPNDVTEQLVNEASWHQGPTKTLIRRATMHACMLPKHDMKVGTTNLARDACCARYVLLHIENSCDI